MSRHLANFKMELPPQLLQVVFASRATTDAKDSPAVLKYFRRFIQRKTVVHRPRKYCTISQRGP